jgi:cytochrome c-type biogenesis protein CcmH/NrfF
VPALARALLLLALALAPGGAAADGPSAEEAWAHQLARELMSPFCPGRALSECPSPQADELRLWIVQQARAGVPHEQVEAELYRTFGDQIRQAPRAEGVGLVAYAVPVAFLAAGAALLRVFLRRGGAGAEAPAPAPRDPALERARDDALAEESDA